MAWFMRRTASSAVRRVQPLSAALASDVGLVREENQDRVAVVRGCDRTGRTFILGVLADGIGGMRQGGQCAALTLATFIHTVTCEAQRTEDPSEWLRRASVHANQAVYASQGGDGGSTLTAILFAYGYRPIWLSIGDSRVYHVAEAKMTQLSRDDTLDGQLGKSIEGGRRSELLQFVGIGDSLEPHIEFTPWDLTGTLLLTTDGVHFIGEDYLGKLAHFAQDLGVCVRRFVDLAKMLGGPDNASVVALNVSALAESEPPPIESAYEVWDPFGELYMVFDLNHRNPFGMVSPEHENAKVRVAAGRRGRQDATSTKGLEEPGAESAAAPVVTPTTRKRRATKQKSDGGRKRKEKAPTIEGARESEGDAPQLSIEFPNKRR